MEIMAIKPTSLFFSSEHLGLQGVTTIQWAAKMMNNTVHRARLIYSADM